MSQKRGRQAIPIFLCKEGFSRDLRGQMNDGSFWMEPIFCMSGFKLRGTRVLLLGVLAAFSGEVWYDRRVCVFETAT